MSLLSRKPLLPQNGFSLIEIAVVLMIMAVLLAGVASMVSTKKRVDDLRDTKLALELAETALVNFVMTNRRLPCPADGRIASGAAGAGEEGARNAGGCVSQQYGVLPWVALGIPESVAMDAWAQRLTYRVGNSLTLDNGMNMFWCDTAADPETTGAIRWNSRANCQTTCTAAQVSNPAMCTSPINFLMDKGLNVRNVAGTVIMERTTPTAADITALKALPTPAGAAFVIISHGETGGGSYTQAGVIKPSSTTDSTAEQLNYADLALASTYVDDALVEISGATHFDDLVARPSILSIVTRASLHPRSHP